MAMSVAWLYMRTPVPNTGAVMDANQRKNLREIIVQTCL